MECAHWPHDKLPEEKTLYVGDSGCGLGCPQEGFFVYTFLLPLTLGRLHFPSSSALFQVWYRPFPECPALVGSQLWLSTSSSRFENNLLHEYTKGFPLRLVLCITPSFALCLLLHVWAKVIPEPRKQGFPYQSLLVP